MSIATSHQIFFRQFAKAAKQLGSSFFEEEVRKDFGITWDCTLEDIREAFNYQYKKIQNWSSDISYNDIKGNKSITNTFIDLDLYFTPKRLHMNEKDKENKLSIKDIFTFRENHVIIYGQPGAGKTTCSKKICFDILSNKKYVNEDFDFPLLIEFFELKAKGEGILTKAILKILGIRFNAPTNFKNEHEVYELKQFLSNLLKQHKLFLILEGFDEIPDDQNKDAILYELRELFLSTDNTRIFLTSRNGELDNYFPNAMQLEISPLSGEQIEEFAGKWFQDPQDSIDFLGKLKGLSYRDALTSPIFLSLTCSIFERTKQLYERPKTAYSKMINLLIEEWDEQRMVIRSSKYAQLDRDLKLQFLAHLAFYFTYSTDQKRFGKNDLIRAYKNLYQAHDLPSDEYFEVIQELESHTGIFVQDGYETFKFYHLSFQEFLTAKHITRHPSIPRNIDLLKLPNELAIATCIDLSSEYLVELVLDKLNSKITYDFIKIYMIRLTNEKPAFTVNAHLGLAFLYMFHETQRTTIENIPLLKCFEYFFLNPVVQESIIELNKSTCKILSKTTSHTVFHVNPSRGSQIDCSFLYYKQLKIQNDWLSSYFKGVRMID